MSNVVITAADNFVGAVRKKYEGRVTRAAAIEAAALADEQSEIAVTAKDPAIGGYGCWIFERV